MSIVVFFLAAGAPSFGSQLKEVPRTRSLHLVGDRDYPPLTYLESGIPRGLDVDIAKAIASRLGVELRIELMDWSEAQRRVLDGRADGLLSMSITDDRRKVFEFTERTLTRDFGLFVRHGRAVTPGTAEVARRRIGVTPGGYPRQFLTARGTHDLVLINNYQDGFNRLNAGAIDAVAADTWVGAHTAQQIGRSDIHLSGAPFAALSGAIAFRKNSRLAKEVDQAIRQMTADGSLTAIQDRWRPYEIRFFSERWLQRIVKVGGIGMIVAVLGVTGVWAHGWRRHRRLEARLRQAQRVETVGHLAPGIAHDCNNLMTVILASCEEGLSIPGLQHRVRDSFHDVRTAADSAAALTRQLLTFSRRHAVQPREVNLNDVISDTQRLLARLIKGNIALEVHQDRQLGHIVADPIQIQQVLVNLAVNARDAMPNGGRLVIKTRNVCVDDAAIGQAPVPAGQYILLAVSDTGIGMNGATLARVFEPFFTTKAAGTGLGLSNVRGIVEQSGGFISACSEVGLGTTIEIYFPRGETAPPRPLPRPSGQPVDRSARGQVVLLVEDDAMVLKMTRIWLTRLGYEVVAASNGAEAIALCHRLESPPALLITDIVLPDGKGPALVEQLRTKMPLLKVLFVSGYADAPLAGREGLRADAHFLAKPFVLRDLAAKVAAILDESNGSP